MMNHKILQCGAVGALSIVLVSCGSTQTRDTGSDGVLVSDDPVVAERATMRVDGLGCPMCAESIAILLDTVEGVEGSSVDLSSGTVRVDMDGSTPVSAAALRQAVDDGGFTFRSVSFEP